MTQPPFRPIICLDFDGVIHSYERGWQGGEIYGSVVPGFFAWAEQAARHFDLRVYSSRSKEPAGVALMMRWLGDKAQEAGLHITNNAGFLRLLNATTANVIVLGFDHEKPAAFITIDDRAIQFRGDWSAPELAVDALGSFKPWTALPP